jgi:N-acetylglucosamine-6-phosphate deacetylase
MTVMPAPSSPAPFTIAAPQLFDGTAVRGPALVTVAGGLIESVSLRDAPSGGTQLPADAILAPGFIDIQVNGGGGVLLNDLRSTKFVRAFILNPKFACRTRTILPR